MFVGAGAGYGSFIEIDRCDDVYDVYDICTMIYMYIMYLHYECMMKVSMM